MLDLLFQLLIEWPRDLEMIVPPDSKATVGQEGGDGVRAVAILAAVADKNLGVNSGLRQEIADRRLEAADGDAIAEADLFALDSNQLAVSDDERTVRT